MKSTLATSLTACGLLATVNAVPYFIIVGDSTSTPDAGWGDGFLAYLTGGAEGENQAVSGTTTVSWQSNGRWEDLFTLIGELQSEYTETIVTMQFGHNDQKVMNTTEYNANLVDMATQLVDAAATPVIITPITRRTFNDNGTVREDFVEWRTAAIDAAEEVGVTYLDLTKASTDYVNAIGEEDAQYYDYDGDDQTHLNDAGETVFGRMVADLMLDARPDLDTYVAEDEALSELIWAGEFATGDE